TPERRILSMDKRRSLLPGVADGPVPPTVVFHSRKVIKRARRRAAFRDFADLVLLGLVDALFVQWPNAHVPAFNRDESLLFLLALNLGLLGTMWVTRTLPRWKARRVAATWCPAERDRLFSWLQRGRRAAGA